MTEDTFEMCFAVVSLNSVDSLWAQSSLSAVAKARNGWSHSFSHELLSPASLMFYLMFWRYSLYTSCTYTFLSTCFVVSITLKPPGLVLTSLWTQKPALFSCTLRSCSCGCSQERLGLSKQHRTLLVRRGTATFRHCGLWSQVLWKGKVVFFVCLFFSQTMYVSYVLIA